MNDPAIDTAVSLLISEIKPLKEYCLQVVEEQVTGGHIENTLKSINKDQRDVLLELLPLNLSLNCTVPIIFDEIYWKRKCINDNWNFVHYWINDCSWRDSFICHYVEESVDNFLSKKQTFGEMTENLEVFAEHLKRVKINGYKGNVMDENKDSHFMPWSISFEENVGRLLAFFPKLEEVYLNIAPAEYAAKNESEETEKGLKFIKDIFSLRYITKLTIIGFSLKGHQISILVEHLLDSQVNYLNLACNLLNDECCGVLATVLQSSSLHTLVLTNNCIGNGGIKNILSGLQDNESLLTLDLSKNYIGDEGGVAVAENLKQKFQLRKLDVSFNKLGYESGVVFNEVILLNSNLLCLNLTGNALGEDVGKMFAKSIAVNKSIRYFGIEFCGFNEQEEDIIYSRIHRNRNRNDSGIFL